RDTGEIMLADVFQRFVFAPLDTPAPSDLAEVRDILAHMESRSSGDLAVPLARLFFPETPASSERDGDDRTVAARVG
ncbi:MAG: hypothetical protein JNL68_15425, partial [Burkholderiales bacterium]|nr:hypothetical protein [Burkholderiales bacterium]